MTPVIAIVGRPNVGKSTLFNRLTRTRAALVANEPGVTRDRRYGYADLPGAVVMLVDTGGLDDGAAPQDPVAAAVTRQTRQALEEADAVLWLVDGRAGATAGDAALAPLLRPLGKPVLLTVNKTDGIDAEIAAAEFHSLGGFSTPLPVAAETGAGIAELQERLAALFPQPAPPPADHPDAVRISIAGRPNVGKSTLLNRIAGEERMLTSDAPGATRDSIMTPFRRRGKEYLLIDTAGIRRRARITDRIEKFSVIKSLRSIEMSRIVILVLDAREGVSAQDQSLLGVVRQAGKSLVLALNKWDGLTPQQRAAVDEQLQRKAGFIDYACAHRISALHGTGVDGLFDSIERIMASQQQEFTAPTLTGFLQEATRENPPPLVRGRPIKLKYAHVGGCDPVRVIIHGNQVQAAPANYQRYLAAYFRRKMGLVGTPVLVEFKRGKNPYGKRSAVAGRPRRRKRSASG